MSAAPPGRRISVLGCDVDALTFDATLAEIERIVEQGRPVQHCAINAAKAVLMQKDPRMRQIVASCALVSADGQSMVWASRLLGRPLPGSVADIDLFQAVLSLAMRHAWGVYFLGSNYDLVRETVVRAQYDYPGLRVCGWHDGYLRADDTAAIVAAVRATTPEILFVGMPSPRKEFWIADNLERLRVPFCMGVGDSFDVYSGRARRAPAWMEQAGLEWLHRFSREPWRKWRRALADTTAFRNMVRAEHRRESFNWGRRRTDREDAEVE
jgi:N-acetylglucosaminyldiphosphoundecaprenol N-acetyl-beta-D-mannosaminyltransferase